MSLLLGFKREERPREKGIVSETKEENKQHFLIEVFDSRLRCGSIIVSVESQRCWGCFIKKRW